MRVAGKVVVVRQMLNGHERIRVGIANQGQVPLTLTNNVLHAGESPHLVVHDDVNFGGIQNNFGHGLPVNPNNASEQAFPLGDLYRGVPIANTSTLRLGFRVVGSVGAFVTVPLSELRLNEPRVIDVRDDFTWYRGAFSPGQRPAINPDEYAGMIESRYQDARVPLSINSATGADWLKQFMKPPVEPKYKCKGLVTIEPIQANGVLTGWMVRTQNKGAADKGFKPFIATIAFDVAEDGKKGLESMAVPHFDSEAAQPMFMGSKQYAVQPAPGTKVRLGVRGLGAETVTLPGLNEKVTINVEHLPANSNQVADEFFDLESVLKKRDEKAHIVQFSENGQPVPVPPPPVFRGLMAIRESDFDPPKVVVRGLEASGERQRGWEIEVTNNMTQQAWGKNVGFIGTVQMHGEPNVVATDPARPVGKNVEIAAPQPFLKPGDKQTWFLPEGADMNGVPVQHGQRVQFGTRGLGWFSIIPLPRIGAAVSTADDIELMRFRPDQVNRQSLDGAEITSWQEQRLKVDAARAAKKAVKPGPQ